jgi:hypothetical protein
MSNISIEEKVETRLVEASAFIIAIGSAALVAVPQLPPEYQAPATAICGTLIGVGASIMAVWHKFVNVRKQVLTDNKPTA